MGEKERGKKLPRAVTNRPAGEREGTENERYAAVSLWLCFAEIQFSSLAQISIITRQRNASAPLSGFWKCFMFI